ncbi:MAG: Yip1 family protein [Vicinamibacterales bacterium]
MASTLDLNVPALKDRVIRILKDPKAEWPVIEAEATTTETLYRSYIAPLAAIPPIATFIGFSIIGVTAPFVGHYRQGILSGIAGMVVSWVLALAGVYIAALIINKLAPTFESTPNDLQALKLVAYASTASWIAGVFYVIPALSILAILGGLYSIYLFYVGVPVMMKTPESKVIPYMVVSVIVMIVVFFVVGLIAGALTGMGVATRF